MQTTFAAIERSGIQDGLDAPTINSRIPEPRCNLDDMANIAPPALRPCKVQQCRIRRKPLRVDIEADVSDEQRWHEVAGRLPRSAPLAVRKWIQLDSSMTRMLQQCFGNEIQLHVLTNATGPLLRDEACLLGTKKTCGHVREVVLHGGGETVMAARTVYTRRQRGGHDALAALGNRPLGEWLFSKGPPRRLLRKFAELAPHMPAFSTVRRAIGDIRRPCWARRTVFLFASQRLLVTEIFLPALLRQRFPVAIFHASQRRACDA